MALRVLVDATGVPADRGALGRYVDGLIGALGTTGIELAVACQLSDEDRYRRLAPEAAIRGLSRIYGWQPPPADHPGNAS